MSTEKSKIAILDSARGVCAFIVALYHFLHFENQHGAFIEKGNSVMKVIDPFIHGSICVFFIISGYVMYLHLQRNNYSISLFLPFMGKRLVRLMIPMFACIIAILTINGLFQAYLGEPFEFSARQFIANITLSSNFVGEQWYNPIFWTLSIEFQFYLFLGIGYLLIRKNPFTAFVLLAAIALALNYAYDTRGTLAEFGSYFIIGISMSLFVKKELSGPQLLLIIAVATADFILNQALYYYVIPLLSIPVLLFVNGKQRFLEFLGRTSFSFYLMHGLLGQWFLYFTLRYAEQNWQKVALLIGAFMLAYFGSHVFYLLIEKPSLKLIKRIPYKHKSN